MKFKLKVVVIAIIILIFVSLSELIPIIIENWNLSNLLRRYLEEQYINRYNEYFIPGLYISLVTSIFLLIIYFILLFQYIRSLIFIKIEEDYEIRKKFQNVINKTYYGYLLSSLLILLITSIFLYTFPLRIFITILISIISVIAYLLSKARKERIKEKMMLFKNFATLIQEKDKIKITEIRNQFKFDSDTFYNKLLEWSERFKFRLDGDYLIFNFNTISDFIDELDKEFKKWGKIEKLKVNKMEEIKKDSN